MCLCVYVCQGRLGGGVGGARDVTGRETVAEGRVRIEGTVTGEDRETGEGRDSEGMTGREGSLDSREREQTTKDDRGDEEGEHERAKGRKIDRRGKGRE